MKKRLCAVLVLAAMVLAVCPSFAYESCSFGRYEQDGNLENGPEEIQWLVLEKTDGRMLLLSEKALDAAQYHEKWREVTWETCSVRKWLQGTFADQAFSGEEKERIVPVTLENPPRKNYKTKGGNSTDDTVFLLSYAELSRYFPEQADRRAEATAYSRTQGVRAKKNGFCAWWLRTPGKMQYHACSVTSSGNNYDTFDVTNTTNGIRPALWVRTDGETP